MTNEPRRSSDASELTEEQVKNLFSSVDMKLETLQKKIDSLTRELANESTL